MQKLIQNSDSNNDEITVSTYLIVFVVYFFGYHSKASI